MSEIVIVPAKPLIAFMVIVEIEEDPGATAAGEVALMPKSRKLNVATVVWTRDPLVPVTARRYVPATFELHEMLAVPDPMTLLGVMALHVRPGGGTSVNVMVPVNPF